MGVPRLFPIGSIRQIKNRQLGYRLAVEEHLTVCKNVDGAIGKRYRGAVHVKNSFAQAVHERPIDVPIKRAGTRERIRAVASA